jgi:hypothetical protein
MALSLNSVTPTGHITIIIYWCIGIFNIRGLTFGHDLDNGILAKPGSGLTFRHDLGFSPFQLFPTP